MSKRGSVVGSKGYVWAVISAVRDVEAATGAVTSAVWAVAANVCAATS